MREILFRGKRIDNGEWCIGFYSQVADESDGGARVKHTIVVPTFKTQIGFLMYEVDPSTIGQYTGLTANGKKIFEGDIVQETITSYYQPIGKICYDAKNCQWQIEYVDNIVSVGHIGGGRIYELLGNIYDTPMLLENAKCTDINYSK